MNERSIEGLHLPRLFSPAEERLKRKPVHMLELAVLQGLLFSAIMSLTIDFIATPQTASISTMLQGFIFRAVIFGAGMYLLALYDKKRAKAA